MQITKLWLINFRNHEHSLIDLAGENIIIGPNGSGKTSILESIDILSTTRSKIVKGINKCIKDQQPGFVITADFTNLGRVVFKQEHQTKTIKLNDEILNRASELIGKINSVIFLPGDIELIQGPPTVRRKYIDIVLSQVNTGYYKILQNYQWILKQRNELLKAIKQGQKPETLEPWDEQLAKANSEIYSARSWYRRQLEETMPKLYTKMGFKEKLFVRYFSQCTEKNNDNLQQLKQSRGRDIISGHTGFGCHSDDFIWLCGEKRAAEFCSQGQQRLISLAVKFAEAQLKQSLLDDPPILLIDDVLLELDLERFNKLIVEIAPQSQKIYTVTDTQRFEEKALNRMKQIKLDQGKVMN